LIYLLEQQAKARMLGAVFGGAEGGRSGRYGYFSVNSNER
jgi:hypothetical protein